MFVLSKLLELGDTIFIVLRKQNLIFLHWYHHIATLLYAWYGYADHASTSRWGVNINYSIHSLMYSYYALRAFGLRIPKQIAMLITSLQIIQMMIGVYVKFYAYQRKSSGENCDINNSTIFWGSIMYFSYFLLFVKFFINSYFSGGSSSKKLIEKSD